jgi:hypothetical protein
MSIDWNRVIEFLVEDDQVILIHSIYIEFNEFFEVNLKLFLPMILHLIDYTLNLMNKIHNVIKIIEFLRNVFDIYE